MAVEAGGGWYWFVNELELVGLHVRLVNPREAKKRMSGRNKIDKLDAIARPRSQSHALLQRPTSGC